MKVTLSGDNRSRRRNFNMFELGDDELFEYVDNYPYPELMGGKLLDAIKRGTKKIKAKVKKVVKKAKEKYKKLPKWAKIATGVLGAPLAVGLAPVALGAIPAAAGVAAGAAGLAAPVAGLAATTAATFAPAVLPLVAAKKMAQKVAAARAKRLALQAQNVVPKESAMIEQAQEVYQPPVQQYQPQQYQPQQYQQQEQYDDQEDTSSNVEEPKKGIPGWLLAAAAALPFFI